MGGSIYIEILFLIAYLVVLTFLAIQIFRKKSKKKFSLNIIFLFLCIIFGVYSCYYRFTMPVIKIKGDKIISIKLHENYNDKGFEIKHPNRNLKVDVINNVDNSKVGIYDVVYSIDYYGNKISQIRKVKVIDDENPIIKLKGDSKIDLPQGVKYIEYGYSAEDNYDGDITENVKILNNIKDEIGTYDVVYTITDSSGNKYSTKRIVNRVKKNNSVIYLTFDDGPSSITPKVLDILRNEDVKATFFIVNYSNSYENIVKRIVAEGHNIGLHSYTHNYKLIYSSEETYFDDLLKLKDKLKNTTGIDSRILRFPGGSSNTISSFNRGIMTALVKRVKEEGFHYFDWNVDSRDAGGARTSTDVYNNVMNGLSDKRNNVVLMHDLGNNKKTIDALEKIIRDAKQKGYSFSKITYNTPMVVHGVNN